MAVEVDISPSIRDTAPSPQRYLGTRPDEVHSLAPWDPFSYVAKKLESLVRDLAQPAILSGRTRVLDYGCASRPYRSMFGPGVEYTGADLPGNPVAEVELRPDGSVPLPDSSFGLILSTQVLEHVRDPSLYLSECYRLLEPGGSLVLSTHGIMYNHPDPEDYWRWTSGGLSKIVRDAGFEVADIRGVLGLAAAALQLLQWATLGHVPRVARRPYTLLMQRLIGASDRRYSDAGRVNDALVLGVRALKPAPGARP